MSDFVRDLGWRLSSAGLTACQDLCKEKSWKAEGKALMKAALDLDLRGIAEPSLPEGVRHGGPHKIDCSPLILQIQKVKNVAVPSGKQNDPSPGKRLLRLQLTDGHIYISATEVDGPIEKLSPVTPPGTKIKLKGSISVINGFILLKKSSTEILGGGVEALLKKWNLHKTLPDNLDREKGARGESGPPQFVKFSKLQTIGVKGKAKDSQNEKHSYKQQSPAREPTREQMELPSSYRSESKDGVARNPRNQRTHENAEFQRRGKITSNTGGEDVSYMPPSSTEHLLSDHFKNLSVAVAAGDIEDLVDSGNGRSQMRPDTKWRGEMPKRRPDDIVSRGSHRMEEGPDRSLQREPEARGKEQRGRGRGRGRGRRHERDEDDDYFQERRKDTYQLCDFIQPRRTPDTKQEDVGKPVEENVLDDYEYDPELNQYRPKLSAIYAQQIQQVEKMQEEERRNASERREETGRERGRGLEDPKRRGRGRGRGRSYMDGGWSGGEERWKDGGFDRRQGSVRGTEYMPGREESRGEDRRRNWREDSGSFGDRRNRDQMRDTHRGRDRPFGGSRRREEGGRREDVSGRRQYGEERMGDWEGGRDDDRRQFEGGERSRDDRGQFGEGRARNWGGGRDEEKDGGRRRQFGEGRGGDRRDDRGQFGEGRVRNWGGGRDEGKGGDRRDDRRQFGEGKGGDGRDNRGQFGEGKGGDGRDQFGERRVRDWGSGRDGDRRQFSEWKGGDRRDDKRQFSEGKGLGDVWRSDDRRQYGERRRGNEMSGTRRQETWNEYDGVGGGGQAGVQFGKRREGREERSNGRRDRSGHGSGKDVGVREDDSGRMREGQELDSDHWAHLSESAGAPSSAKKV